MTRTFLFSKIHRATVTQCNLNYEGSITIDKDLLDASGLFPFEKVDVLNINNGERFSTYIIQGIPGSGIIAINGAGARLAQVGDKIIILAYMNIDWSHNIIHREPNLIFVDENNKIVEDEE